MPLSLLSTSFIEFLQKEWLGLVASLIVLVSFLMTNQIKIRIINMVGCIAFVIYGLLLPTYSTAFMNGAVFIVHVVFLIKYFVQRRKEKLKTTSLEAETKTAGEGEPTTTAPEEETVQTEPAEEPNPEQESK